MSIQGVFNSQVTKATGVWTAASFVQFSALLVCLVAWFITERIPFTKLIEVDAKYTLLGGVIGAFITYTVVMSIHKLGPAQAALFIVVSQLTISYIIQIFGLFGVDKVPFSFQKMIGMLIAIVGVVVFQWE